MEYHKDNNTFEISSHDECVPAAQKMRVYCYIASMTRSNETKIPHTGLHSRGFSYRRQGVLPMELPCLFFKVLFMSESRPQHGQGLMQLLGKT